MEDFEFAIADVLQDRHWRKQDGVIYFSVMSDGRTGEEWVAHLVESKRFRGNRYAKAVLRSSDFQPMSDAITEVAVLKGMLFKDYKRITKNIRAKAYAGDLTQDRKLSDPNVELACLIREKFSDKEIKSMGLRAIVAMHEPIKGYNGYQFLLGADRGYGGRWLHAYCGHPDYGWIRDRGFAFALAR